MLSDKNYKAHRNTRVGFRVARGLLGELESKWSSRYRQMIIPYWVFVQVTLQTWVSIGKLPTTYYQLTFLRSTLARLYVRDDFHSDMNVAFGPRC